MWGAGIKLKEVIHSHFFFEKWGSIYFGGRSREKVDCHRKIIRQLEVGGLGSMEFIINRSTTKVKESLHQLLKSEAEVRVTRVFNTKGNVGVNH